VTNGIKAIFFDIGGTLVEKTKFPDGDADQIIKMIELLQLDCTPDELMAQINRGQRAYKTWCQRTMNELTIEEKWVRFLLQEVDQVLVRKLAPQLQDLWRKSKGLARVRQNALPVLNEIGQRGYILGTISHSTPAYLDEPGLADLMRVRIHAPVFGKRKPHPSLFFDAARQCGVALEDCAYVGDNPWRDVVGPREAGYGQVILMKNGSTYSGQSQCVMQPDLVIHDLSDLLGLFPQLGNGHETERVLEKAQVRYDVALSTMYWDKEHSTAEEFFSRGRELGFARYELNHQVPPDFFDQIDFNRFSIGSLHDPCPAYTSAKVLEQTDIQITSLNETLRRQGVDVLKGTIEQAYRLGSRLVVVHPGRITGDHSLDSRLRMMFNEGFKGSAGYEELRAKTIADRAERAAPHLEKCLESLREIVEYSRDSGIIIALENRFHYYELPVFDEMVAILEEFTQPWLGWQFDIGHLQVHDRLGLLDMKDWLEKFGSRIVGLHLHDVTGIKDHRAPGSGEVDFQLISKYLPLDCYRTLEVDKSLPYDEVQKGMQYLFDQGCIMKL
jgi:putative hydrolase of the HAD superfamily